MGQVFKKKDYDVLAVLLKHQFSHLEAQICGCVVKSDPVDSPDCTYAVHLLLGLGHIDKFQTYLFVLLADLFFSFRFIFSATVHIGLHDMAKPWIDHQAKCACNKPFFVNNCFVFDYHAINSTLFSNKEIQVGKSLLFSACSTFNEFGKSLYIMINQMLIFYLFSESGVQCLIITLLFLQTFQYRIIKPPLPPSDISSAWCLFISLCSQNMQNKILSKYKQCTIQTLCHLFYMAYLIRFT